MTTYEYRCDEDGDFDVTLPFGTAPAAVPCEVCGSQARRVFTVPILPTTKREIMAALDTSEKSRYEPEVVTAPPPTARAGRRPNIVPKDSPLRRRPGPLDY